MCGRFELEESIDNLTLQFEADEVIGEYRKNYNIAPTQNIAVVRNTASGRAIEMMRWGLVPVWAKDIKMGYRMINARMETIKTKNTYANAFKNGRCVIPASGFFEWKQTNGAKQPYFIYPDEGIFAFAGMWESWQPKDDPHAEPLHSCTIITTPANKFMAQLHDRMPAILNRENIDVWMDNMTEKAELLDMLQSSDAEICAHAVSTAVNNVRNQGEDLIKPLPGEPVLR